MGGVTALAAAFALGRIGTLKPTQTTALVALLGFISIGLVPFLKYPATPPAVGNPETIGDRTTLYFTFLAISVLAIIAETTFAALLLRRGGSTFQAVVFPALGFLAVVGVAAGLEHERPAQFVADDLEGTKRRLKRHKLEIRERVVPEQNMVQLFVKDPNDITIELNFPASEDRRGAPAAIPVARRRAPVRRGATAKAAPRRRRPAENVGARRREAVDPRLQLPARQTRRRRRGDLCIHPAPCSRSVADGRRRPRRG